MRALALLPIATLIKTKLKLDYGISNLAVVLQERYLWKIHIFNDFYSL